MFSKMPVDLIMTPNTDVNTHREDTKADLWPASAVAACRAAWRNVWLISSFHSCLSWSCGGLKSARSHTNPKQAWCKTGTAWWPWGTTSDVPILTKISQKAQHTCTAHAHIPHWGRGKPLRCRSFCTEEVGPPPDVALPFSLRCPGGPSVRT